MEGPIHICSSAIVYSFFLANPNFSTRICLSA